MSTAVSRPGLQVIPPALTEREVNFYKDEGYLVLRNLLSREQAGQLYREVMDLVGESGLGLTSLKQVSKYLRGSGLDELVNSPVLKAVAGRLMGGPSSVYLPFTAVKSGGGGGRFHFHQDNQYTRLDGPACNIWIALSPMREETGCLQIVPKSHLQGTFESEAVEGEGGRKHKRMTYEPQDFLTVALDPGDAVVFTRLTVHGSGVNRERDPRVAYAVQFHKDGVKARWEDGVWYDLLARPRWNTRPVDSLGERRAEDSRKSLDGH